jgi:hypothetical protein
MMQQQADNEERVGHDVRFQANQNPLRIWIQLLVYPSVLGSVLYSFFGNLNAFTLDSIHAACMLMMVSIIMVYSIDYVTSFLKERYTLASLISDAAVVTLMYIAFASINFLERAPNVEAFCLCFCGTFAVFSAIDYRHRKAYGRHFKRIFWFEIFLVAAYLLLAVIRPPQQHWWVAGLSAVTSTFVVYFFAVMYHSSYLANKADQNEKPAPDSLSPYPSESTTKEQPT